MSEEKSNQERLAPFREKPVFYIDDSAWKKMMYWTHKAPGEISGLGLLQPFKGTWRVTDVFLLEQENTGGSTDIDPKAVTKLMHELRDEKGHLNFWWHSHVEMGTFWSDTDKGTMEMLGRHGWFFSTVVNKKRERRTAFYGGKIIGGETPLFIDEITTKTLETADPALRQQWDEQYDTKVKERKVVETDDEDWKDWRDKWKQSDEGKKIKDWLSIGQCFQWMLPDKDDPHYDYCTWSTYFGTWRRLPEKKGDGAVWWDFVERRWVDFDTAKMIFFGEDGNKKGTVIVGKSKVKNGRKNNKKK